MRKDGLNYILFTPVISCFAVSDPSCPSTASSLNFHNGIGRIKKIPKRESPVPSFPYHPTSSFTFGWVKALLSDVCIPSPVNLSSLGGNREVALTHPCTNSDFNGAGPNNSSHKHPSKVCFFCSFTCPNSSPLSFFFDFYFLSNVKVNNRGFVV